eukprot:s5547_g4.t1
MGAKKRDKATVPAATAAAFRLPEPDRTPSIQIHVCCTAVVRHEVAAHLVNEASCMVLWAGQFSSLSQLSFRQLISRCFEGGRHFDTKTLLCFI